MTRLVVAGLQLDVVWGDKRKNFERVRRFAAEAKERGVELLVLPEMFATGFLLDPKVTAEGEGGETIAFLRDLAREHRMAIVGGLVRTRRSGKGANVGLAVAEDGRVLAEYSKTHLVSLLGEDAVHEAGAAPRPFSIAGVEMACFVCYDLRFPELFRLVAAGTGLVMVIASWPAVRQRHWDLLLPARAVENQQFVVGVNRVGEGGGHTFLGGTAIYDPLGNALAAGGDAEGLVVAELDLDLLAKARKGLPALRDRRF
ncbi:MAG: carbon-nitrogen family hydrolase [Proteobacteria bacterium]|jgi:predicted amidohydrolase|nr:carbon-nitrogen family hydrolase [Pseudomonadota bacterium]